jgi:hypothetical protein
MFRKTIRDMMRPHLLILAALIACSIAGDIKADGKTLVDSGFRSQPSGFSFPNWSGDEYPYSQLTSKELVRLFGDRVCIRWEGENCIPTPGAMLWMEQQNAAMKGGHCEGMAALSSAFHVDSESPTEYGASPTFSLKPNSRELLTTISTYWVTQNLDPVDRNTRASREWSLQQIVDFLVTNLSSKKDYVTLGIYGEGSGHAITPYKIDEIGPKKYRVYVYDNNHPGAEKFVDIDAGKDQWSYALAAINPREDPSPWQGGAGTMDVTLLSTRYKPMVCPFCGDHAPPRSPRPAKAPQGPREPSTNSQLMTLETPARCSQILITGKKDKKQFSIGTIKKNEIKGASMSPRRGSRGCNIKLPPDQQYDFQLVDDGRPYRTPMTDVYMYTPGNVYSISNVAVSPQSTQTFTIGTDVFTFQASGSQKPTLRIAGDRAGSNGYYEVTGFTLGDGYAFTVQEGADGKISFSDNDPALDSFDLKVEEIDEAGTKAYDFQDVDVPDKGEAVIDIDDPNGVALDIDSDSDGTVDEEDADDDNDGTADANDTDDDGDGILDDKEVEDADHDGTSDAADLDDDNDGTPDTQDNDDDGDGTPDGAEKDDGVAAADTDDDDHDGTPDATDTDDDNDGIPDTQDSDDDGDGTPDGAEHDDGVAAADSDDDDHDGTPDATDTDDDNDGTPDTQDSDDDGDGTPDDADHDGTPDVSDTDDDNDGISDAQDQDDPADDASNSQDEGDTTEAPDTDTGDDGDAGDTSGDDGDE